MSENFSGNGGALAGATFRIHEPDLWRNVGENLSRRPEKQSALAILHPAPREGVRRTLRQGAAGA